MPKLDQVPLRNSITLWNCLSGVLNEPWFLPTYMARRKSSQKEKLSEPDACNKVIKAFNETNKLEGVLEYLLEACDNSL